ncbi:MAG: portal protein, partial [Acidobacteriaceae bacterium]
PEWNDANQKPYSVLTYKPISVEGAMGPVFLPPPQRQPPAQIEAGFSEFVQGMRSNLVAVSGMPNEPGVDQQQGVVVSGQAIKRRQWLSDQSHFQYYDNLTLAIAQCWRVMVEWIPHYFSESRMQRIIREDTTAEIVPINQKEPGENGAVGKIKNDLSVGRYDVVMDTGPGYDTKREEGAENLVKLLGIGPLAEIIAKSGADLVFRAIDHPYMQELADRLMAANPDGLKKIMDGLSSRAKSVVQSLANENAALKQQLQQAEMELKVGLAKAHMGAVVKAHDTEMRAQTQLAVEEIRAGGKLLDSKATHGHDREMLERQLTHDATMAAQDAANALNPAPSQTGGQS